MTEIALLIILLLTAALSLLAGFLLARWKSAQALQQAHLQEVRLRAELEATQRQLGAEVELTQHLAPLTQALGSLSDRLGTAERERVQAHEQLRSALQHQHDVTQAATLEVQREARKLTRALSRTHVRGNWGETELRRLVEASGMLERVHFELQATTTGAEAPRRPDLIIHLAGNRDIVVDAKAPLDALLESNLDDSDTYSQETLAKHAAALRAHVDALAKRDYSALVTDSPEIVVLYLPAESLLSLALTADAGLLDHAFSKNVALATPTTLLALLRTAAHGWRQESVAQNARAIHEAGTELHNRLLTMSGHLAKMGRALDSAVGAFNATVGSYENRVLTQARKFSDLGLVTEPAPEQPVIESAIRSVTVVDLDLSPEPILRVAESE